MSVYKSAGCSARVQWKPDHRQARNYPKDSRRYTEAVMKVWFLVLTVAVAVASCASIPHEDEGYYCAFCRGIFSTKNRIVVGV